MTTHKQQTARVLVTPISCRISDDFAGNYAFTRYGTDVAVLAGDGDAVWQKEVWQRGTWLRWRPCYDRRLARALRKAQRVAAALRGDGGQADG